MRRGYRSIVIAVVGWLALAASPQDNRGNAQGQSQQSIANSLQEIAAVAKGQNEPSDYERECDQGKDNRRSDLCAQWKAADAAESAANATWAFGYAGVIIGLLTLGAASAAAYFAKEAADHTKTGADEAKRAADAAESSLEDARLASRREFRPWLLFENFSVNGFTGTLNDVPVSDGMQVAIHLRNNGRSPASSAKVARAFLIGSPDGPIPDFGPPTWGEAEQIIGINQQVSSQAIYFGNRETHDIISKGHPFYVQVHCRYRDPAVSPPEFFSTVLTAKFEFAGEVTQDGKGKRLFHMGLVGENTVT